MNIIESLREAEGKLIKRGMANPRLDAEVLLSHATGLTRVDLYMRRKEALCEPHASRFEECIGRRLAGEPVAYITGVREFWSLPIKMTKDVMIPRPETELVVDKALKATCDRAGEVEILDLCTGSGCIAAALATELPNAHFTVTDISTKALSVAKENLSAIRGRLDVFQGDLFNALISHRANRCRRSFDIITANPPYISAEDMGLLSPEILEFEPHIALSGGPSGLDLLSRIILDSHRFLRRGGWLIMEMGLGHGLELRRLARETGAYGSISTAEDLSGTERVIRMRAA